MTDTPPPPADEAIYPVGLQRLDGGGLAIDWSDGQRRRYRAMGLRDACPCATCREKDKGSRAKPAAMLPVLSAAQARPLEILAMQPAGRYAYSIQFSDGHHSGLYTFDYLHRLGMPDEGKH